MLLRGGQDVRAISNEVLADVEKDHENIIRTVMELDPTCSSTTTFVRGTTLKTLFMLSAFVHQGGGGDGAPRINFSFYHAVVAWR